MADTRVIVGVVKALRRVTFIRYVRGRGEGRTGSALTRSLVHSARDRPRNNPEKNVVQPTGRQSKRADGHAPDSGHFSCFGH